MCSAVNLTFLPSISPPPYEEYARVIIEEGIKIAETAGGPEAKPIIALYKQHGIYVIHKTTVRSPLLTSTWCRCKRDLQSIRHAKSAVKLGVDCLSIDGFECAGHPGRDEIGGLLLLALAAKELDVPYIASGGIGNGRGLAAAIALGAQGVNAGTIFMATKECQMHQNIKDAMVAANELSTVRLSLALLKSVTRQTHGRLIGSHAQDSR